MAWIALVSAGLLEICWAVGLKYTDGFRRPLPTLAVLMALLASLYLLTLATRHIPLGTAYAIWVGLGALGTVLAGALLFGEPLNLARLLFLGLLLASIVGLKLTA
jgi:quaternary ammonium compound-resistance protein SugE